MSSKKIILFIVEGIADQISLGYILNNLLSNHVVQFQLNRGDVTSQEGNHTGNIVAKIGNIVRNFSGSIYKPADFLEIVHLVDLDGAFITEEHVVEKDTAKLEYQDPNIYARNVKGIQLRNKRKSEILERLISLKKVYRSVPYSVYFFSSNLDHVLHNNPNMNQSDKTSMASQFEKEYGDQPENFLKLLNEYQCNFITDYKESWNFIKMDTHSLQRYSNFNLYFPLDKVEEIL